jgi:cobyrinic acid a,c-diamide synthase
MVLDRTPAGHGYEEVMVDQPNPFIKKGTILRGHEFHYSRLDQAGPLHTILQVRRGTGLGNQRDGLTYNNVVASYLHLHALGTAEWAVGLLGAAASFARSRG